MDGKNGCDPLVYIVDEVVSVGGRVKRISVTNVGYDLRIELPKDYRIGEQKIESNGGNNG
jgi:hypothetical protein